VDRRPSAIFDGHDDLVACIPFGADPQQPAIVRDVRHGFDGVAHQIDQNSCS
jgi:hypothetical protein